MPEAFQEPIVARQKGSSDGQRVATRPVRSKPELALFQGVTAKGSAAAQYQL